MDWRILQIDTKRLRHCSQFFETAEMDSTFDSKFYSKMTKGHDDICLNVINQQKDNKISKRELKDLKVFNNNLIRISNRQNRTDE